ncbi:uncharacterized protein [Dendrobates tinctorius]|uniref:uncharacterized protein n=1 Tax=Dendrobates tinctorius TaxID=92724 RepID=UPI003CC99838
MSDPTVTSYLTKLLCSHGGRLPKDQLSGLLKLPPEQVEQILKDKSQKFTVVGDLVLAQSPVRICPKYLKKEQEQKCDKLHLCKEYLQGKCKRSNCKLHHDISSSYNQTVLKVNEISGLNIQELKVLLLQNDKQLQPEMPKVSIRNFQMLCDVKHNERLQLFHEAVKMENSAAISDGREVRKRKNSDDAPPQSKLPRIQEEPSGTPAGLMSSTISAFQSNPITTPLTTASPVDDSQVNVPMIGPKPVPLQLVDLPNIPPMAHTSPSKLVDSVSPSVPLKKEVITSSPLEPQPFATIIKPNTPPSPGPFTAPSSSYIRLPNSPTKGSAVPLQTAVTTPMPSPPSPQSVGFLSSIPRVDVSKPTTAPVTVTGPVNAQQVQASVNRPSASQAKPVPVLKVPTMASTRPCRLVDSLPTGLSVQIEKPVSSSTVSPSNPQSNINFMKSSACPKVRISRVPSSGTTLVNSLTKSLSHPLEKPAITSIESPSNPQPAGLSSSITSLSVFQPKPDSPPMTFTGPANAPLNGPPVSQAIPVPYPVPVVNISNVSPILYTTRRRLVDSLYTGPYIPLKKPVTTSTTSPSIRQLVFTFMNPSTPPAAGPSFVPSSCTKLNNSPSKGPSVPLENQVPGSSPTKPYKVPEICLSNLWKYCNQGRRCPDMHYYLPYRWQIHKGTTWEDVPNMEEIEKSYCDPKMDRVLPIDFLTMRSGEHRVRRLSTVSSVVKPSEYVLTTEWLWYWRDEYGSWTQYGQSNENHTIVTISSSDLENIYLADANANAVIPFSTGENSYEINFRDMKQKNIVYKTERDVRRRPKYLSFDDVKLLKGSTRSAAAESLLKLRKSRRKLRKSRQRLETTPVKLETSSLNTDIYPKTWDPEAMPEIGCKKVLVSDTSSEFLEIVSSFSKTVTGHEVKMWRLQNPSLWQVFQWQKEHMKKVNQGQDVMEMQLFHGTDSTHIDAICDQNFDWRICGTHGTVYGQVLSKRGRRKLVHENHIYLFSKRTADDVHSIWVCEKRSTRKGRVWTNEESGEVVKVVNLHNHAAQAARPEAIRLGNEAVTRARTTQETPQQVLTDVVSGAHSNVAALLPRKASLKRTIRLARQLGNIPRLPQTLDQLVIPLEFQEISIDGVQQQFLLHDSGNGHSRMLIFGTRDNLHLLAQSKEWFADGMHFTTPALFKQLYTIHVVHSGLVVPVVYTLLTDKSRSTYQRLLQELKNLQPGLQPHNLMLDCELAAIQAFESEFPNLVKTGCSFHLKQSVWRKVQNEGLKMQYQGDHEFARWIHMIPALAFLPPQNVVQSFEELVEDPDFPQEAIPIARSYFARDASYSHYYSTPTFSGTRAMFVARVLVGDYAQCHSSCIIQCFCGFCFVFLSPPLSRIPAVITLRLLYIKHIGHFWTMSDPTVTASLMKLLCSHGGWLNKDWINVFMKLPTKQIEQILNDEPQKFPVIGDLVLAQSPVRICSKYLKKEQEQKCDKLHLCKEYLQGKCKRSHCSFFHDISAHHNQSVLKVNGICSLNIEEIKYLLLQNDNIMLPEVCRCYMLDLCVRGQDCSHLHICDLFIRGECDRYPCKHSHNLMDLGASRLQMSEVSIRNFQMLCEVKCIEIVQKAGMMDHEMCNPAAIIDRRYYKRKYSEDRAPQRKLPRIQEEPAGTPAGLTSSTISAVQKKTINVPMPTAGPANASPVNDPMNDPSVIQEKPVSIPQLLDLPNVQPLSLSRPSRMVDSLSPSVPLEKPVTTSITSPLVPQSFATIMKPNTPPATGPSTAPSSAYTRLHNSPMKRPSVPLEKQANSSIASASNPQSVGLLSSTHKLCVSQPKPLTTPVTTIEPVNAPTNGASVSQAKPVPSPATVVKFPTTASTTPCRLVDSISKSPSVHLEKPETTCTGSPSNPKSVVGLLSSTDKLCVSQPKPLTTPVTIIEPVNAPTNAASVSQAKPVPSPATVVKFPTRASTTPCRLVDSISKSPSVHLEKPETTCTGSPSNPQSVVGLLSSTHKLCVSQPKPLTTPVTIIEPVNAPTNAASVSQAKPVPSPATVVKFPTRASTTPCRLVDSISKSPSVHLEKPETTCTGSPSNPQSTDAFIKPILPPKVKTSTVPPSSFTILANSPTKGPHCPLENPQTNVITSTSNPHQAGLSSSNPSISVYQPSIIPVAMAGPVIAPPGSSVHLEKPVTTSAVSPSVPQQAVAITNPNSPPAAGLSTAPSSCYKRLIYYPTTGPSVPLEKPAIISIAVPSNPPIAVTFTNPSTLPEAGPSTAPSSSYTRFNHSPMKGPSVPLENPVQSWLQPLTPVPVCQTRSENEVPEICLSNLWKYCSLGKDCPDMHYYLPYRWQIHKGTDWEDVPNMKEIEKSYCDPKVDRVSLIDFLTMRSDGHPVRRLSTVSSVVKPSEYVLTTEWLWYWRDEYGSWTQYGQSNVYPMIVTISSSYLENIYLANANAVIPFGAGNHIYEINYQDMKQKNIRYKTERDVRRRPKYLSFDDVKLLKGSTRSAAAKSPMKSGTSPMKSGTSPMKSGTSPMKSGTSPMKSGTSPMKSGTSPMKSGMSPLNTNIYPKTWDPEAMPEIGCKKVLVLDTSSEFLKIGTLFSMMVKGHEVKKMWRLQNPSLWQVFQWQKNQMKKVNQGRDVKEIRLFHGTDSAHIDAICDQNFDWRICGTHGTSYGQGSYFAHNAAHSHNFSIPNTSGTRAMFIARVLVGDYVTGSPQMKRPPLRPGSSLWYYDSCVNNVISPSIFVVFEKHQIYPEYLLEYEEEQKRIHALFHDGVFCLMCSLSSCFITIKNPVEDLQQESVHEIQKDGGCEGSAAYNLGSNCCQHIQSIFMTNNTSIILPTGTPAGLSSVFQRDLNTTPVTTAGPARAQPVNDSMNGPSVSQTKPVSSPLQLVDLANVRPMALTKPNRLVDSVSPSVPLEKPVTTSMVSPLEPNPFVTIVKTNTPPAAGPFTAPSSNTRLTNFPTKDSAVPLKTPVTTSITSPCSQQPTGLSSSIPRLRVSQPKSAFTPVNITAPANAQPVKAIMNCPSDSQAKPVPSPAPVVNFLTMASTTPCRLFDSLSEGPSVQIEKPVNICTASPSVPQSMCTFMESSTCPEERISKDLSSIYSTLFNSLTKGPSCSLEKPTITSIAIPSNPPLVDLSSLVTSVSLFQPKLTTPPVTFTGPANAPQVNTPLNGSAVSKPKPPPFLVPEVPPMVNIRRRRLLDSLDKDPSVPQKKPVTTSTTSPSIHQSVFTFMNPSTPPAAGPSTASSSCAKLNNSPTKSPSVPLENLVDSIVRSQTPIPPICTVPDFSPTNPDRVPEICLSNLWKYCSLGSRCPDMHYYLPYRWQIHKGTDWEDVPNMEEIEKSYCDPKVDRVPLIEFLTMRSGGHPVPRLSTVSSVMKPSEYVLTTEWLWYWRDEHGSRTQYGQSVRNRVSVTISSSWLENIYLADADAVIPFAAGRQTYELSFRDMKQKNIVYMTERDVRRRPKYLRFDDVKLLKGR